MVTAQRLLFLVLIFVPAARAQTGVERGPGWFRPFLVEGRPFLPHGGWHILGDAGTDLGRNNRRSVEADLDRIRSAPAAGVVHPVVMESMEADGRVIAQYLHGGWYNYVGNYLPNARFDRENASYGHVRPGAYVEGMKWFIRSAHARGIYTLINLQKFIMPFPRQVERRAGEPVADGSPEGLRRYPSNVPYHGYERIGCADFNRLIAAERAEHRRVKYAAYGFDLDRIRPLDCRAFAGESRPYWEWNLRYVIHTLRDETGLLGWYVFDEAEDPTHNVFFCADRRGNPTTSRDCRVERSADMVPWNGRAEGPQPPNPDLLRYAYDLIGRFESEGDRRGRPNHPRFVEIGAPQSFFHVTAGRFGHWRPIGNPHSGGSSGPFDVLPGGGYRIPADVLVQEASGNILHTGAAPDGAAGLRGPARWDADPNTISYTGSAMLADVARANRRIWGVVHLGQGQLPDNGCGSCTDSRGRPDHRGFGRYGDLKAFPNDQLRTRLLTDRDIVWQGLTPLIDGARGLFYWTRIFTPKDPNAEGAKMAARMDRFSRQLGLSGLGAALLQPPASGGWEVASVRVNRLTDYVRQAPGPTRLRSGRSAHPEGVSPFDARCDDCRIALPRGDRYSRWYFGRYEHADPREPAYGRAVNRRDSQPHTGAAAGESYRLLRTSFHEAGGRTYLFLSNAYDAQITVALHDPSAPGAADIREAVFDLDRENGFGWKPLPAADRLEVTLAPYEVRVFRVGPD